MGLEALEAVPSRWDPDTTDREDEGKPRRGWSRQLDQELMLDLDPLVSPLCLLGRLVDRLPPVDESWEADDEVEEDEEESQEGALRVHLYWSKVGRLEFVGWAHLLFAFEKSCELLESWAQEHVS